MPEITPRTGSEAESKLVKSTGKTSEEIQSFEESVLSEEIRDQYRGAGASSGAELVLPGSRKKRARSKSPEQTPAEKKLSKSQRKRVEHLKARKIKEANRKSVLSALKKTGLSEEHLSFMRTTSMMGQKESIKQRLQRNLKLHRAGVAISKEAYDELFQEHTLDDGDHPDFPSMDVKPQALDAPSTTGANNAEILKAMKSNLHVKDFIENLVNQAEVVLFSKTWCPLCTKTKTVVQEFLPDANFEVLELDKCDKRILGIAHEYMMNTQGDKKVPHLFVKAQSVGGAPETVEMARSGKLLNLLNGIVEEETPNEKMEDADGLNDEVGSEEGEENSEEDGDEDDVDEDDDDDDDESGEEESGEEEEEGDASKSKEYLLDSDDEQLMLEDEETQLTDSTSHKYTAPNSDYCGLKDTKQSHADDDLNKLLAASKKRFIPEALPQRKHIHVKRSTEIQTARMGLPVCGMEQEIMETIDQNSIVLLCGETGSGKTTQLPQFLYEAGYGVSDGEHPGRIAITQPRRVAAVSTAHRVAHELGMKWEHPDCRVGYQIRHESENMKKGHTRVKFMTDGVLLREVQSDLLLREYSVILLDEAHERNLNTDILVGLLSRIVPLREKVSAEELASGKENPLKPLKVVIMSATLRVEDFTLNTVLFSPATGGPPPVVNVPARQYPVTVHFSKETEMKDYVGAAFKKVCQIHKKLPPGGILIFLTGEREIMQLVSKLRKRYMSSAKAASEKEAAAIKKADQERDRAEKSSSSEDQIFERDDADDEADEQESRLEDDDDDDLDKEDEEAAPMPMNVLPLFARLPAHLQMAPFVDPSTYEGTRMVVVASNVAETSVTIPGVRYVVDCGRQKEKVENTTSGISEFQIQWTSQASAAQRAGRAGRTGPGHVYRLYSSAVFNNQFEQYSPPEVLRRPVASVILQMKAMGISDVLRFPFPTPPPKTNLIAALRSLRHLGALQAKNYGSDTIAWADDEADSVDAKITPLGHQLASLPLEPQLGRMMVAGFQFVGGNSSNMQSSVMAMMQHTIALIVVMSFDSPIVWPAQPEELRNDEEGEGGDDAKDGQVS
jgi:HrpA-like RNA helicase/glutaredoxin